MRSGSPFGPSQLRYRQAWPTYLRLLATYLKPSNLNDTNAWSQLLDLGKGIDGAPHDTHRRATFRPNLDSVAAGDRSAHTPPGSEMALVGACLDCCAAINLPPAAHAIGRYHACGRDIAQRRTSDDTHSSCLVARGCAQGWIETGRSRSVSTAARPRSRWHSQWATSLLGWTRARS